MCPSSLRTKKIEALWKQQRGKDMMCIYPHFNSQDAIQRKITTIYLLSNY